MRLIDVDLAETVEAIPIEWIKKKAIDTDDQGAFTTAYLMLLEDWKKERIKDVVLDMEEENETN